MNKCLVLKLLTALWWLPLLLASGAHAAPQLIPGTRVQLDLPPGFEISLDFTGIVDKASGAAVRVAETPMASTSLDGRFTKRALAAEGLVLLKSESATIAHRKAELIHVKQIMGKTPVVKWMARFGIDHVTVFLIATMREADAATMGPQLRQVLLQAQWDPFLPPDYFQALPFKFASTDAFQLEQRTGEAVGWKPLKSSALGNRRPWVLAEPMHETVITPDNVAFESKKFVLLSNRVRDIKFTQEHMAKIAGMDAYEIEGTATSKPDDVKIGFYQAVIWRNGVAVALYGQSSVSDYPIELPGFKAVAQTVVFQAD